MFKIGHFQCINSKRLLLFECFFNADLCTLKTHLKLKGIYVSAVFGKAKREARAGSSEQGLSQDKDRLMTMQIRRA